MRHVIGFCAVVFFAGATSLPATDVVMPSRGICAHRGANSTHPENTLAAFHEAIRLGAHQIELDVYFTKDRQLAVIHDATVDRTTDGHGRVADFTLAELKKLDAGIKKGPQFTGARIPTLAEALKIMPRNVWINVHLKGRDAALGEAVAREIVGQQRQHQAFLACGHAMADAARCVAPDILICNMHRTNGGTVYVDQTIQRHCRFIQPCHKIPSPEDIAKLKAAGIRVNLFGTDNPKHLKQPGYYSTNDPAVLKTLYDAGIDFPLADKTAEMLDAARVLGIEPLEPVY